MKTILKCPECNKWIVDRNTFEKTGDVLGYYNLIFEDEKVVGKITKADFLVRTNIVFCNSRRHHLVDINVKVEIILKNHTTIWITIPAAFCSMCNKYYILESDYQKVKKIGYPVCRVEEQKYNSDGSLQYYNDMSDESFLYFLGYNVNASNNMSTGERQALLMGIVDGKIMSREEICAHLDFLVRRNNNNRHFSEAISKWTEDRDFIASYSFKGIETIEVSSLTYKTQQ